MGVLARDWNRKLKTKMNPKPTLGMKPDTRIFPTGFRTRILTLIFSKRWQSQIENRRRVFCGQFQNRHQCHRSREIFNSVVALVALRWVGVVGKRWSTCGRPVTWNVEHVALVVPSNGQSGGNRVEPRDEQRQQQQQHDQWRKWRRRRRRRL